MRKRLIVCAVFIQIIIILVIGINIYQKKKQFYEGVSVSPITENDFVLSPVSELKYFYEPKANSNDPYANKILQVDVHYTINNDSLNERFNYPPKKTNGTFRIITLGDSFTYGMFVNTEDNWTELLEDRLNSQLKCKNFSKFEVINFGVGGYDNRYSVERFKKRGTKYNPDLILWLQTDMFRINEKFYDRYFQLQAEASKSGELQKQIKEGRYYIQWGQARKEIVERLGENRVLDYQKNMIKQIENYYKGPLILLSLPTLPENQKNPLKTLDNGDAFWEFYDRLRDIYYYGGSFPDAHPNQKGHRMIAEDVFNHLKNSKFISCK